MDHQPSKCAICRRPTKIRATFSKSDENARITGWFSVPEGWWVRSRSTELVQMWDVVCPECYEGALANEKHLATEFTPVRPSSSVGVKEG